MNFAGHGRGEDSIVVLHAEVIERGCPSLLSRGILVILRGENGETETTTEFSGPPAGTGFGMTLKTEKDKSRSLAPLGMTNRV